MFEIVTLNARLDPNEGTPCERHKNKGAYVFKIFLITCAG
jgi:hypothetical protein